MPLLYTIEAPGIGYYTSGTIAGTSTMVKSLTSSLVSRSYNDQNKGIYVKTNNTNSIVIGQNTVYRSSGTFLALPTVNLCLKEYVYYGISVSVGYSNNVVLIVGTENSTVMNLTVTQSVPVKVDDTVISLTKGIQYSFIINRLQTVYIGTSSDLSGTRVVTDKPVSVFSGHECGSMPSNYQSSSYCDHLIEQIPHTTYWGKTYYVAPLQSRRYYSIRVLAAHNSTEVILYCNNARSSYSINAGEMFTELQQYHCAIHSNKVIIVAQYGLSHNQDWRTGDPMMMLVPATVHYSNEIIFPPFHQVSATTSTS